MWIYDALFLLTMMRLLISGHVAQDAWMKGVLNRLLPTFELETWYQHYSYTNNNAEKPIPWKKPPEYGVPDNAQETNHTHSYVGMMTMIIIEPSIRS